MRYIKAFFKWIGAFLIEYLLRQALRVVAQVLHVIANCVESLATIPFDKPSYRNWKSRSLTRIRRSLLGFKNLAQLPNARRARTQSSYQTRPDLGYNTGQASPNNQLKLTQNGNLTPVISSLKALLSFVLPKPLFLLASFILSGIQYAISAGVFKRKKQAT